MTAPKKRSERNQEWKRPERVIMGGEFLLAALPGDPPGIVLGENAESGSALLGLQPRQTGMM